MTPTTEQLVCLHWAKGVALKKMRLMELGHCYRLGNTVTVWTPVNSDRVELRVTTTPLGVDRVAPLGNARSVDQAMAELMLLGLMGEL